LKKRKIKKLPSIKSLQNKAEKLWKEVCFLAQGRGCSVKRSYPEYGLKHDNVLQVDHCFSRNNKFLFLEPANGTVVCEVCNWHKSHCQFGVEKLIDQIVLRREGYNKFHDMLRVAVTGGPNKNWSKRWWLIEKIAELTSMKVELLNKPKESGEINKWA